MKQLKVTLVIILAIIALGLVGVIAYVITTGNGFPGFQIGSSATLVNERSIVLEDINDLKIDYTNNYFDVYVYESESEDLIVKEYMSEEMEQDNFAKIDASSTGNLYIKGKRINSGIFWFNSGGGYVEVYIPKDYSGSLSIKTTSGEIVMDKSWKTNEEISLASSSGDIMVNDVTAKIIAIAATSGNIYAESLNGSKSIAASSGDIKILGGSGASALAANSGNIYVKDMDGEFGISTSSGDIDYIDGKGYGRVASSSGNVIIELDEVLGNIDLSTTSGDVTLRIPENINFEFDAETTSGDINTFFDENLKYNKDGNETNGTIGNNSNIEIVINASSGNVNVSKK